jgi:hypothetical protein
MSWQMVVSLANLIALCNHGKLHAFRDPAADHVYRLATALPVSLVAITPFSLILPEFSWSVHPKSPIRGSGLRRSAEFSGVRGKGSTGS